MFKYVFNAPFTCFCHILLRPLNNDKIFYKLSKFLVGRDHLFSDIYSESDAYLKVRLCPAAATDGAVSAQPVAPRA